MPDTSFSIASLAAMVGWTILIFAPRRWPLLNGVPRWAIPLALSVLYSGLVLANFSASGGGYGSIAEVRQLFASDQVLVAGWAHCLAFDLMIGAIMAERMDRAGVQRPWQAPVLCAILMFGPLGLLLAVLTEAGLRPVTRIIPQGAVT
ncbi:ABA4-like family protein [Roseisalinus antarcticus]|uniref:DUF4281 domain-containing protein n=1 Tax=Roseisalinus antarcticus TaxID=254357 RepID=A0A1Y5TZW4_9RHOB|nr:ABA4-like family protein [Roseisalinus antarcticus]SLN72506.1 hypothetical protein ROA7023_03615 [Roseisalinus antarcticus]